MSISRLRGHGGPHRGPKTTRDTPKVAAFCFVRLIMLVWVPLIYIFLCRMFFWSDLPHLSLGWAYRASAAMGAPTAAPKQPEIPLRSLHFALPWTSILITGSSRHPAHLHRNTSFRKRFPNMKVHLMFLTWKIHHFCMRLFLYDEYLSMILWYSNIPF